MSRKFSRERSLLLTVIATIVLSEILPIEASTVTTETTAKSDSDNDVNANTIEGTEPILQRPTFEDSQALIRAYNHDARPICPCGLTSRSRSKRVIGGTATSILTYPYAVSIRKTLKNGSPYPYCGGTLITEQHVITASHCLVNINDKDPNELTVEIGRTNISGSEPLNDPSVRRVVLIQRHPAYDRPTYNNDIAILHLDRPVKFLLSLRPVCLPPYGSDVRDSTPGTVVGWGRTSFKGKKSEILLNVTMPVVNRTECQKPLKHRVSTNMICAGGLADRDACVGDSGGPLIVHSGKAPLLVGVVSFGKKCGLKDVSGVYTRVGLYIDFIYEQTLQASCKPGIMSMRNYRGIGETISWSSFRIGPH